MKKSLLLSPIQQCWVHIWKAKGKPALRCQAQQESCTQHWEACALLCVKLEQLLRLSNHPAAPLLPPLQLSTRQLHQYVIRPRQVYKSLSRSSAELGLCYLMSPITSVPRRKERAQEAFVSLNILAKRSSPMVFFFSPSALQPLTLFSTELQNHCAGFCKQC